MKIGETEVEKGERKTIELHLARLYDFTELTLPVHVIRGQQDGPTLFISGAVHGDELVGTAIVKKILNDKRLKELKGTLIAIPIVNVFGFNTRSRYLPDRRDLNRCFPGSPRGSLASRVANLFLEEIVKKSQFGIDFHSGALHRNNLPQIRTNTDDPKNKELADAFGVPVILNSKIRDGSLREAASELGVTTLLFEGGEALRVDDRVVRCGVAGAFSVMEKIGMLSSRKHRSCPQSFQANSSYWVRAPQGGMIKFTKNLGAKVDKGTTLGVISDSFGKNKMKVIASAEGVIIGQSVLPIMNKGDALFHIATFTDSDLEGISTDDFEDYSELFFN